MGASVLGTTGAPFLRRRCEYESVARGSRSFHLALHLAEGIERLTRINTEL